MAKIWWLACNKGGLYVVFDALFQNWSKSQYLQHMRPVGKEISAA